MLSMSTKMKTEIWYFVTRDFQWQSHGEIRAHKDYLVGVRYPVIGDGPYCGPNPESITWVSNPENASSWNTEESAAMVARITRDTEAKVERRTMQSETIAA
jgi:hypothetical protein